MNESSNEIIYTKFRIAIEKEFGEKFTVSNKKMEDFINGLIESKKFTEDEIMKGLLFSYRDYRVERYCLESLFRYLGYKIPNAFCVYAEKTRILLHEVAETVGSEVELVNKLLIMYQNYNLNFTEFEIACYLMGYEVIDEFRVLPDEERRNAVWILDKNNILNKLNELGKNLLACCKGLEEFNTADFFIPSFQYENPMDFVYDFMEQKGVDNKVLVSQGLDRKKKYKLTKEGIKKKIDAFRLIFILDMNVTEAKQFMTLCGFGFSPLIKSDIFFLNYLNGKYKKVKTLLELTELSRPYCYENFYYTEWL